METRPAHGRYRGRRRVVTAPRARYAAVATTALVGAGVVALGAGSVMPDLKAPDPTMLAASDVTGHGDAGRQAALDRASRGADRGTTLTTVDQPAPDVWLLPLRNYGVSSGFGQRWGVLHPGVDLAVPEGTPYYAAHAGTVTLARWNGGYGYCVIIDVGNGVEIVHGHSSKLLVHEGQQVQAGDLLGLVGDTGYSFGPHLHFELRVDGRQINPVPWMKSHGVDIPGHNEAIYGSPVTP